MAARIEQFGEGLFIQLKSDKLDAWFKRTQTWARLELRDSAARWQENMRRSVGGRSGGPYMLAHSVAHTLMTEIALDCALRFADLHRESGIQGMLGGLIELVGRFRQVLRSPWSTFWSAQETPSVPTMTRRPGTMTGHCGAACHGCLLIAETSCEARNLHLDRALLVDTMAVTGAGFFKV